MNKRTLLEKIKEDFVSVPLPIQSETPLNRPANKSSGNPNLIPIRDIQPDTNQPRKMFDQRKLEELASSIRSRSIIQPLIVRPDGSNGGYTIVTGERRFRAAILAGLTEIPCIIRNFTDEEALVYQIIENVQREDLTPIEEAKSFEKLTESGLTQSEIASLVGKSQPYISQILKILNLPKAILNEANQQGVSKEHLLQLSKSEKPEQTWADIKRGKTAKEIKTEAEKGKNLRGRPQNYRYHYNPKGKPYRVTVEFKKPHADNEEIMTVLNEALNNLTLTDLATTN